MTHAKLSPSSSSRWLVCPGSLELSLKAKQYAGEAAIRGNVLHDKAHEIITKSLHCAEDHALFTYVNYIRTSGFKVALSEQVVGDPGSLLFGTADCVLIYDDHIVVVDLKTGFMPVSPVNNTQLLTYAYLAQKQYNLPVTEVVIVQGNVVKSESVTQEEIEKVGERANFIIDSIINKDSLEYKAGDHCKYCPAKFICDTYRESVSPIVKQLPVPSECGNEDLSKLLDIGGFLTNYIDTVKKEVDFRALECGEKIPGYKVVQSKSRRSWDASPSKIEEAFKDTGIDVYDRKLRSFTDIEKQSTEAKELVSSLVKHSLGKLKVVPTSNPSPEMFLTGDLLPPVQ